MVRLFFSIRCQKQINDLNTVALFYLSWLSMNTNRLGELNTLNRSNIAMFSSKCQTKSTAEDVCPTLSLSLPFRKGV